MITAAGRLAFCALVCEGGLIDRGRAGEATGVAGLETARHDQPRMRASPSQKSTASHHKATSSTLNRGSVIAQSVMLIA